jgi:acetyl-CoA carboxylase / biotin carboxylase 1
MLSPLYTQIAHEFADLHDRAGRMKAKGVIDEVLQWNNARAFFFWRIQKRQVNLYYSRQKKHFPTSSLSTFVRSKNI